MARKLFRTWEQLVQRNEHRILSFYGTKREKLVLENREYHYDEEKDGYWITLYNQEEIQERRKMIAKKKLKAEPYKEIVDEIIKEEIETTTNKRLKKIEDKFESQPISETLNVEEAATLLSCSVPTVRKKIKTGEIKAVKIGKAWDIDRDELEAYRESKRTKGTGTIHQPVKRRKKKGFVVDTKAAFEQTKIQLRRKNKE